MRLVERIAVLLLIALGAGAQQPSDFLVSPYLQLGNRPQLSADESLSLLWHTGDSDAKWQVEVQATPGGAWKTSGLPAMHHVSIPASTIAPHRVYETELAGLKPGAEFSYRVSRNGAVVFSGQARARKAAGQPYRFAVFGDCADGSPTEAAVAYQTYLQKPDFLMITGDIVYTRGSVTEYRQKFYPYYSAKPATAATGAPLLSTMLLIGAPGNHDALHRELDQTPDAMAYFYYWSQPLNGPPGYDSVGGSEEQQKAFRQNAGTHFPDMASFSFDYGNSHWTVLDSNPYLDWSQPALAKWVSDDIAAAKGARWHFVAFHHPGFQSSTKHFEEQQMRVLAPVLEKAGVDVVFSGHVHNYQRSVPMRFAPKPGSVGGAPDGKVNPVAGQFTLDTEFDGIHRTKPNGVIYIVDGGGGAHLYNPEQQTERASWQSFTVKYLADIHSFSVVDIDGDRFTLKQISEEGKEVDAFTVTK